MLDYLQAIPNVRYRKTKVSARKQCGKFKMCDILSGTSAENQARKDNNNNNNN